jgi:hypothetical protein
MGHDPGNHTSERASLVTRANLVVDEAFHGLRRSSLCAATRKAALDDQTVTESVPLTYALACLSVVSELPNQFSSTSGSLFGGKIRYPWRGDL